MAFDVRAKVTTSLPGELISATISDSFIPGAGLIKTTGTALMKAGEGGTLGGVTFSYERANGLVFRIPRLLYVISYAADPLRGTVQYELGCQLTLKERVRRDDAYKLDPDELELDECFDIVTKQIEAKNVVNYALGRAGLTILSGLTNKFSIKEFDLSGGYVSTAADLEYSEGRLLHQNLDSPYIEEAFLVGGAVSPVRITPIDVTPVTSGEIPGSDIIANYTTLKLLDADLLNAPNDLNWEEEETIGSVTHISVRYEDGDDEWESSFAYIPYQKTVTAYDEWERVVRRVTTTETIGAALSPNYVQALIENDFKQGASILGAASLAFGNTVFTTTTTTEIVYVIPCREVPAGACNFSELPPPLGYEEVEAEVTIVEEPLMALAGSVPGSFFDEDDNLDTIGPETLVTSITTVTYEQQYRNVRVSVGTDDDGNTEVKRIGSFPVTKTKTHFTKAYAYTSYGQMELAMRARQGRSIGEMLEAARRICDDDVEMRIVTGREAAVQIRPSLADRIFNYYRDKSDTDSNDNGFGTERRSEKIEVSLTTGTSASGMIEVSIPYSSDDSFERVGTPPNISYKSKRPDPLPEVVAEAVAKAQAQLIIGAKSGISVQALPESIPSSHIGYVEVNGGIYLVNGRTYTLDANGAVASFDGIAISAASGTPSSRFPVPTGLEVLDPPTTLIGKIATISGNPQTVLDAAFPNADAQDAVKRLDTGDYWVYDGTDWVFKGQSPGAVIVNTAPKQYIGTIATVGTNPQTTLNTAFPSRVMDDGVRALDTNYVWVYDGAVWINRDQNPGEVLELPPGSTVGLFNVEVRTTSTIRSRVAVTKFDYALELLSQVPSTTVRSKAVVNRILKVLPPAGGMTLAAAAPAVSSGASAQVPVTATALSTVAPVVSGGGSIAVPSAAVSITAHIPVSAGTIETQVPVPNIAVEITATAPDVASGASLVIPLASVTIEAPAPKVGYIDPYFSSVSLLLHMDGANGSTTFADSSNYVLTPTANGNVQISTAQSKFGGASALFDGSGDYISIANNAAFQFGTGNFTIETWFYASALTANFPTLVANGNTSFTGTGSTGALFVMVSGAPRKVNIGTNTTNPIVSSTTTIVTGQWYHLALTRSGTTVRLFLNGVLESTATNSQSLNISNNGLQIGRNGWDGVASHWNGYIDELRITKGVARYTASFSPPAIAFPNQ